MKCCFLDMAITLQNLKHLWLPMPGQPKFYHRWVDDLQVLSSLRSCWQLIVSMRVRKSFIFNDVATDGIPMF